jgi:hypothetical protein
MSDTTQGVVGHYWDTVVRYWCRIVHHWRGHYPLSQSFWFNYLSVSTCLLLMMIWCLILALLFDYRYFDRLLIACAAVQSSVWSGHWSAHFARRAMMSEALPVHCVGLRQTRF